MERRVAATEVRTHFGQILREVTEKGNRIIVERSGHPLALIMSMDEYNRLKSKEKPDVWQRQLARIIHEERKRCPIDGMASV